MAHSKAILIVGYFGFGNAGDEAILSATLTHFRGRRADLHILVASGNPQQTAAAHGVVAIPWNDMAAIHRAVQSADLVVIGGGGLFHDYFGVDPDVFLTDSHWGVIYYAGPALLSRLYRKRMMLFGVGVGPLYSEYGRKFTRLAASLAHAVTVRDLASKQVLEELGISGDRIGITADPGFLFEAADSSRLQEALPDGFELRRPLLGVAVRRWSIGVAPDFLERELAGTLDLFLKETGGTAVLIPFQDIAGEIENDRSTAGRVLEQLRLREQAVVAAPGTPGQIYGWLSGCDVVLGMRLHSLIFAALAGVPAVALVYDLKVREAAAQLGLAEFSQDATGIDALRLARLLSDALARREDLGSSMRLAAAELRQKAAENVSVAMSLLEVLPAEVRARPEGIDIFSVLEAEGERVELTTKLVSREKELAETRRRARALEEAKRALEASVTDLRAQIHRTTEQRQECLHRLRDADVQRTAVARDVDRFAALLHDRLAAWRAQRAWQVMLLLRKGYTLFHRSKPEFLRWAAGLVLGRVGNLQEYDLELPDPANYIPETFRRSWITEPADPVPNGVDTLDAPAQVVPEHPPQRDRYDVVILAIIDFDFRFQRPQQIAAELARQGHRVFWISPTRFLPASSTDAYAVLPLRDNLWEIHLRNRQPDIYMGELGADDVQTMAAALDPLYREWAISEHVVLVQLPFWRRLALRLRGNYGSTLVYDCMDDWETFENMGAFNVNEEKELVRECDILVVTGAELERKFRGQGLNPVLARNGADYRFFAAAAPNQLLAGVPRPIIGYFGAIADWIDLDLVRAVAERRPQYSFVLIGQVFGRDVSRLEAMDNVRLLGNRPYADIPSYLYEFDACLIPFLLNQVTKATDPVKLYEYLSLGRPVVATAMAELSQCGDLLYIGKDAEEFAHHIDTALAEKDPGLVQRRIEFARANTWTSRVEQIDAAVREAFPLVSILIVTYNSAPFVRPCLDSLLRNTSYPHYEIVLVDNASSDGTVDLVRGYAGRDSRVRVFPLPENLGFAGGNNYAARESRGEYLVFLNVDTMVTAGWVGRLVRHVHRDSSIGLLCPVTNFAGNEIKINVSYTCAREMERFARSLAALKNGERFEIRVAPLYCALMPRAVWDQVGEMDACYEIGMFEDDDLSLRVRQAGFGVFAAEDTFIHHFGQGSFSKLAGETYNRIFEANRKRFEEKWKQPWVTHRTRPGVRPAYEEKRFDPAEFVQE